MAALLNRMAWFNDGNTSKDIEDIGIQYFNNGITSKRKEHTHIFFRDANTNKKMNALVYFKGGNTKAHNTALVLF